MRSRNAVSAAPAVARLVWATDRPANNSRPQLRAPNPAPAQTATAVSDTAATEATQRAQVASDPLGQDLGTQRILRRSPRSAPSADTRRRTVSWFSSNSV